MNWDFLRQSTRIAHEDDWPIPLEPCLALPGTEEKMEVMLVRLRTCSPRCLRKCRGARSAAHVGYQPTHPADATWLDFARLASRQSTDNGRRLKNGADSPVRLRIDGVDYGWHVAITPLDRQLVETVALRAIEQAQYMPNAERRTREAVLA